MEQKADDRRVRRTKLALRTALIKLMTQKGVKNITVKELCDESDINRGTFYLHYQDVDSLLRDIERDMLTQMEALLKDYSLFGLSTDFKSPILRIMFSFLAENADLCRAMLSVHGDMAFVESVKDVIRQKFMAEWFANFPDTDHYPSEFVFTFVVSGSLGVLQNWLLGDMSLPPERMASMVETIIIKGAAAIAEESLRDNK